MLFYFEINHRNVLIYFLNYWLIMRMKNNKMYLIQETEFLLFL